MRSFLIINRKGGVGKTTLVCHSAWLMAETRRVLVVELDTQQNASTTLKRHVIDVAASDLLTKRLDIPALSKPGLAVVVADNALNTLSIDPGEHIPTLKANLDAADYDICIFDVAGAANPLNIGILAFATHVLAPITLQSYSIQGVGKLLGSIIGMQERYNPDLHFLGILPNYFDSNSPDQKAGLRSFKERFGDSYLFKAVLTKRQAYERTSSTGQPAWMEKSTAGRVAGKEIRAAMEKVEREIFPEEHSLDEDRP